MRKLILSTALCSALAAPALAEMELSLYTGWQTAPHSRVKGDVDGEKFNELFAWEGKSFQMPPYYGVRAMWWQNDRIGYGLEFTHAKVYAAEEDMEKAGFSRFEMTDGHNIITLNAHYRWLNRWGNVTPYVGGGLGFAMPHVDTKHESGSRNYEYQVTGPAMRLTAGANYKFNDRWAVFGEYQFTASDNDISFDGGGSANTLIKTNALNIGLSASF